jgi:tetratricopeptide (TPR) repeat protein
MARSARVNADRIGALLMQGNALASQAPHRDAIRCYEKILELAPRNLDAINNRGNCLSLFGEFAEAIKSYDATSQRDRTTCAPTATAPMRSSGWAAAMKRWRHMSVSELAIAKASASPRWQTFDGHCGSAWPAPPSATP